MQFELLAKHHNKQAFGCGNDEIDQYLKQMASQHMKKQLAKVYVLAKGETIIGFYSLTVITLILELKGYPKHIPAVLIGRIGVDTTQQEQGIGRLLLAHALKKAKQMSLIGGVAFVVIDAKSDELVSYYEKFGFLKTAIPYRLIISVNSIDA